MILAFDTYYFDNKAKTVCIAFESWEKEDANIVTEEILEDIAAYQPGEFYKRELPCIISLLKKLPVENFETIIVDGYVFLDDDQKPGLGDHLYRALACSVAVIGVAKTNYATLDNNKRLVLRGESSKPLYVTAIGIGLDEAAKLVKNMKGPNRIPALLKRLDTLTKEKSAL